MAFLLLALVVSWFICDSVFAADNITYIQVDVNEHYAGVIGDGKYYQFQRMNQSFNLYTLELRSTPIMTDPNNGLQLHPAPITMLVVGSDNFTYFTLTTDSANSFALCSEATSDSSWNFFLSGEPYRSAYNFSIIQYSKPQITIATNASGTIVYFFSRCLIV